MASEETARSRGRPPKIRKKFLVALWVALFLALITMFIPWRPNLIVNTLRGQAKNDAIQLKNGISSYFTEYRRYPIESLPSESDATVRSNHELMDILLGSDSTKGPGGLNSRAIPFYFGAKAKPMEDGRFRKGITPNTHGGGELWDPWGNHYRVIMDTDGDGQVKAPDWFMESEFIPQGVIVWSPGPDGDDATAEDNVVSWSIDA